MNGFSGYSKIFRRVRRPDINRQNYSEIFLENPKNAVLFLDFDGTLAPIQEKPDFVHLPEHRLKFLKTLSLHIPVFVLSGRSIPDLMKRLPLDELAGVSGDHGASRIYRGMASIEPNAENARNQILPFATVLEKMTEEWPGVYLERKQFSLSMHYRQLAIENQEAFFSLLEKTFLQAHLVDIEMRPGKCVFEFRHSQINKESALKWFLQRMNEENGPGTSSGTGLYPVMIGDDTTDWNAIKSAIDLGGVGIWVGQTLPDTTAPHPFRLSSPDQVWEWLESSWNIPDRNP